MGIMSAGGAKDRGEYQWSSNVGNGNENGTAYISFGKIPEGEYRSKGSYWAPEIRANLASVENKVVQVDLAGVRSKVISADRNGVIAGLNGTTFGTGNQDLNETTYLNCNKGKQWVSVKIRNLGCRINNNGSVTVYFDASASLEPSGEIPPYRRGAFTIWPT